MSKVTVHVLDNIGQEMVKAGVVSSDQLAVAQETKKNLGGDLGHILIKKGFVTEEQILEFLSHRLKIPFISLENYELDPDVVKLVPVSIIQRYRFMPLFRIEDIVTVAMSNPLDVFAIDDIRALLKYRIQPVFASTAEIDRLIELNYPSLDERELGQESIEVIQYGVESAEEASERLREMAQGSKVIAEVNRILKGAVNVESSDIHLEPTATSLKIRDRIDGVLEECAVLPKSMHLPIVSRIKVMGAMDIAERRIPQDGRVRLRIGGQQIDMRISTYPTMHGEKVVIRLLNQNQIYDLEEIGFTGWEKKIFEELITKPYGVLLVTGPTGSGKTTTLYAALQRINSQDRNIISIEDPIENEIVGVSQAQVNIKAGMTFASALRSILRQDPDVIMIGEIRDRETADISVRAAITGHLVFSTLHTNTAVGAIGRLADLGVEPFMISSGLIGIVAQRLVRRICTKCAQPTEADPIKLKRLRIDPKVRLSRGKGCKFCRMSGYAGRIGIFEIIAVTGEVKSLIARRAGEEEIMKAARRQGTKTLWDQAIELVKNGTTTVDEVFRITESFDEEHA